MCLVRREGDTVRKGFPLLAHVPWPHSSGKDNGAGGTASDLLKERVLALIVVVFVVVIV